MFPKWFYSIAKLVLSNKFYSAAIINLVKAPILFFHGGEDPIIPIKNSKKLYSLANNVSKKYIIIPNANHENTSFLEPDLYWDSFNTFIEEI